MNQTQVIAKSPQFRKCKLCLGRTLFRSKPCPNCDGRGIVSDRLYAAQEAMNASTQLAFMIIAAFAVAMLGVCLPAMM